VKPHTPAASLFPDQYVSPFLSDLAVRLIKTYTVARTEIGLGRFASYKTEHGEWRIGYGSKRIGKVWAGPHFKTTQKEVDAQLIKDLEDFCVDFSSYVYMPLNVKKRAAIVGYAHSVGLIAFKQSNLLKLINERATKNAIIKEWSPFINPEYRYVNSLLKRRRRVELNLYLAPDAEVPLFTEHKCPLKQCLLNLGESYMGTPNQIKAIEYLERKLLEWDPSEETLRRFWRYWNQEQGGLGSPRSL
jgi:GH24 family phage-related lysozyme (muramidase)